MKDIFERKDFESYTSKSCREMHPIECAIAANKKINELIESWPVFYGSQLHNRNDCSTKGVYSFHGNKIDSDTFKARICFIEEIPKKICKHESSLVSYVHGHPEVPLKSKCLNCGVELVAEWKAVGVEM